jgi:hypothetical protein
VPPLSTSLTFSTSQIQVLLQEIHAEKLFIAMSAPMKLKRTQGPSVPPTNVHKNSLARIKCLICTKLGRVLDCCKGAHGVCSLCTELHRLLTQETAKHAEQTSQVVTVYGVRTSRVPRVLSLCSSLHSLSTFPTGIHQRYVM